MDDGAAGAGPPHGTVVVQDGMLNAGAVGRRVRRNASAASFNFGFARLKIKIIQAVAAPKMVVM